MRFPRNQGRALLERVASGEIKGAQCLTSQLIIIDDLSKSSRGQVRMQGAREKGYGRQCRGSECGLRLPFSPHRRAGFGKSCQHSTRVWKGDTATTHAGFRGFHGIVPRWPQHLVHCTCSINELAAAVTFANSLTTRGRRGHEQAGNHQGFSSERGRSLSWSEERVGREMVRILERAGWRL